MTRWNLSLQNQTQRAHPFTRSTVYQAVWIKLPINVETFCTKNTDPTVTIYTHIHTVLIVARVHNFDICIIHGYLVVSLEQIFTAGNTLHGCQIVIYKIWALAQHQHRPRSNHRVDAVISWLCSGRLLWAHSYIYSGIPRVIPPVFSHVFLFPNCCHMFLRCSCSRTWAIMWSALGWHAAQLPCSRPMGVPPHFVDLSTLNDP